MVLITDKKIVGSEISNYFATMRDCFFTNNSLILQPKSGVVTFNFSQFIGSTCSINFRRDSGNGLFLVSSNGRSEEFQITSKTSQPANFKIGTNGLITINRTFRSRGDIAIIDISICTETKPTNVFEVEISKALDYGNLRYLNDRLFAYKDSFIVGRNVKVKTKPSDSFVVINSDRINFTQECQIIDLSINPKIEVPIVIEPIEIDGNKIVSDEFYLYNSDNEKFDQKYCIGNAEVKNDTVVIGAGGSYVLPLRFLTNENKFLVSAELIAEAGNGMFGICVTPGNDILWQVASNAYSKFTMQAVPKGDCTLSIIRHPGANGNVTLRNCSVISDKVNKLLANKKITPIIQTVNSNSKNIQQPIFINSISESAKNNSRFCDPLYSVTSDIFDIKSSIKTNTYNGNLWWNICKNNLPNVSVSDTPEVSISCVGSLIAAKVMFIEPFISLSENDVDKILTAEKIIVSSENNAEKILRHVNKNIIVRAKALPKANSIPIKYINDRYILMNYRNNNATNIVLEKLKDKKVVLLNARGKFSKNIIPVNEYINYSEMSYLFENAQYFIEFTDLEDEKSQYIDLARDYGKQIVTSSWEYMNDSHAIVTTPGAFSPDDVDLSPGEKSETTNFYSFVKELFG